MDASEGREQPNIAVKCEMLSSRQTDLCVVGGGPAGMMLALLMARKGIEVTLLEEHGDFNRDFRGDTVHPSTMEVLQQIGLADGVLALPHSELRAVEVDTAEGPFYPVNFSHLKTQFPFVTFIPQREFLDHLAKQAQRFPAFSLIMKARVEALMFEDGVVHGVVYRGEDGWHEVRAQVTVGCDGRFSRLRKLGGFKVETIAPPLDVLWFRLPRHNGDPQDALGRFAHGHALILLNRGSEWQTAYVIPKGSYKTLRAEGLDALRAKIASAAPELADRVSALSDWSQVAVLSVASDRLRTWHRPGLLLIGDAAHAMSPVGGVGINYAVADAVTAANFLYAPLRAGHVTDAYLAEVQRVREPPTRRIQWLQGLIQKNVVMARLETSGALHVPLVARLALKIPGISAIPARMLGHGFSPARLTPELAHAD